MLHLVLLQGVILPLVLAQEGPVVSTKYGLVEGMSKETAEGNAYDEFRGIPFGAPAEGSLRWQKPQEPSPWDGILPAKEYGRTCAQVGLPWTSEDCLYLNIYVPDGAEEHVNDPIPVLVWIYGGAFLIGSARTYNGQLVSTRGRVVVVTINYRVGVTGFLSTENEVSPGNYGLWDQIAALRWVQDNIASFGGDIGSVTIIGQSAGGMSVSHLALSPAAQGLFHRVIALSGSAANFFERNSNHRRTVLDLAEHYNCPFANDEEMVECLRNVSAASININGLIVPAMNGYRASYIPNIDHELVIMDPLEAMELGLNANYDLLAGRTLDDGSMFSLLYSGSVESFRDYLLSTFNVWSNNEELVEMVYEQYPNLSSEDPVLRDQAASQMVTDFRFGLRVYQEVGYHSENAVNMGKSTYFYEFDYSYLFKDSWISGMHIEDVIMFFGDYSPLIKFDENDDFVSRNLQAYYCNFAYTGNPNEGPHPVANEWPQYDTVNKMQMRQSVEMTAERVSEEVIARYDWWNDVFYPAAVPADPTNDPKMKGIGQIDTAEVHRRAQFLAEKLVNLDYYDPLVLQALAKAMADTGANDQHDVAQI